MPARYYVSTAVPTTLSSSLGSTGNPSVAAITGWPASFPFTALLDWGLFSPGVAYQEAISVTSITGTGPYTLVCTRGTDGTSASAHSPGALVVHGVTAEDFSEPQAHIAAAAAVHGLAGSVVGTTDTQTLTNKSLTSPALTGTPVAPTAAALTGSTQVATTAYADLAGGGLYNVKAYGATGNGTTDDTTAIQAAITAAGAAGGVVYFPPGTYLVSAALILPAGTTLTGAGIGVSVILLKASASVTEILGVTANQLNYSVTICDLQINGNKANSATATHGIYMFAPTDCIIQRVRIVNVSGNAITLDGSGTFLGTATKVLDSFVRSCGGNGLNITQYCTDTLVGGCDVGSCTGKAYYANGIQIAIVGSIGWGSSEGLVCDSGSGEVWVSGSRFDQNQYYGVWVLCPNFTMSGSLIYDNSAVGTGTEPGMVIDSGASDTVVSGCRFVGGLNSGPQQSYGIQLSTGRSGPAVITGCDVLGNGTGAVNVLGTVTGDRISDCPGYNPVTAQAPGMASSGVAYTNPYPYSCTVYLNGGAVSNVQIGGFNVPLSYSIGGVRIPAGQTITVTYTGSPTWTWFGD